MEPGSKKLAQRVRRKKVSSETHSQLEFSMIRKLFWHQFIRDLRAHFKNPVAWLPALLERTRDDAGLDETMIRDSLKQLDQAWDMYTDSVQSHTVFRLVSRVTIYPKQVGIQTDVTALIEFILDLKQICDRQQEKA